MRKSGCAECKHLWEEYSAATFEHVKIDNRMKLAQVRQDVTVALSSRHEAATLKREDALRRLQKHETTHAGGGEL